MYTPGSSSIFVQYTGTSRAEAEAHLLAAGGDLDRALNLFFDRSAEDSQVLKPSPSSLPPSSAAVQHLSGTTQSVPSALCWVPHTLGDPLPPGCIQLGWEQRVGALVYCRSPLGTSAAPRSFGTVGQYNLSANGNFSLLPSILTAPKRAYDRVLRVSVNDLTSPGKDIVRSGWRTELLALVCAPGETLPAPAGLRGRSDKRPIPTVYEECRAFWVPCVAGLPLPPVLASPWTHVVPLGASPSATCTLRSLMEQGSTTALIAKVSVRHSPAAAVAYIDVTADGQFCCSAVNCTQPLDQMTERNVVYILCTPSKKLRAIWWSLFQQCQSAPNIPSVSVPALRVPVALVGRPVPPPPWRGRGLCAFSRAVDLSPSGVPLLDEKAGEITLARASGVTLYDGDEMTFFCAGTALLTSLRLIWYHDNGSSISAPPPARWKGKLSMYGDSVIRPGDLPKATPLHAKAKAWAIVVSLARLGTSVECWPGFGNFSHPKVSVTVLGSSDAVTVPVCPSVIDWSSPFVDAAHTSRHNALPPLASVGCDGDEGILRLSFREGGYVPFSTALIDNLGNAKARQRVLSYVFADPSTAAAETEFSRIKTNKVGIDAVVNAVHQRKQENMATIKTALRDVDSLCETASRLVQLANKFSASRTDNGDELTAFDNAINALGMVSAPKLQSKDRKQLQSHSFVDALAREMCDVLLKSVAAAGGIVTVSDCYCLFHKNRRNDMFSPADVSQGAVRMNALSLPLQYRVLPSGTPVLHLRSFTEAADSTQLPDCLASILRRQKSVSATEYALSLGIPCSLAEILLLEGECSGLLCRDVDPDTRKLLFWRNVFL